MRDVTDLPVWGTLSRPALHGASLGTFGQVSDPSHGVPCTIPCIDRGDAPTRRTDPADRRARWGAGPWPAGPRPERGGTGRARPAWRGATR